MSGGCILWLGLATLLACLLACLLWFRPCAPSLEVPTFSLLAPSRGPFGWSGFCWLPLGFGLSCLFWGSPCVTPVVSCLPWGCLCLVGAGRLGPPDGMEWLVCGRCLLLARALLAAGAAASAAPTSLRCLFGGSSVQSIHTSPVPRGVFCNSAIKAAESDHEMVVQSLVQTRQELRDQVSLLFYQWLGIHKGPLRSWWVVGQRCQVLGWQKPEDNAEKQ